MRLSRTRRWRRPSARSSRTYRRDRAAQDTEMLTLFEAGDLHPRIAYVLYGEPAYASPEASACGGGSADLRAAAVGTNSLGREPINSESSADVRFVEHSGLKSDIARGSKSASNRLMHRSRR